MADLNNLRVSEVAELKTEAGNFGTHAENIHGVTEEMLGLIEQTNSLWRGDAQNKFATQFAGLRDDMDKIYKMCKEYSEDLTQIAQNYENAETQNAAQAAALKADVELV